MNHRSAAKIGAVGAALGLALGAASVASASTGPAVHSPAVSTAAAPKTLPVGTVTGLPKGAHVTIVSAATLNALRASHASRSVLPAPGITQASCSGQWGVQIDPAAGGCVAFGYVGMVTYSPALLVDYVYTDNNSGVINFDKDHQQYSNIGFGACVVFNFETGSTPNGALENFSITGYTDGVTCSTSNVSLVTLP